MKSVLAKVAKIENQKVELASERVELALADDIKTALKNATAEAAKMAKTKAAVQKSADAIAAALKSSGVLDNKQLGKAILQRGAKFQEQFLKMEKELGVSLKGSEPDKLISELFMQAEDLQGNIDDILSSISKIGK
jgi:hypothetical protein